jgi:hypothetical protein
MSGQVSQYYSLYSMNFQTYLAIDPFSPVAKEVSVVNESQMTDTSHIRD